MDHRPNGTAGLARAIYKRVFVLVISATVNKILTVFSCDQTALRTLQTVCLSVRLPVRPSVTPFSLCSHHRIIMQFSGVITNDKIDVHAKGQGQR